MEKINDILLKIDDNHLPPEHKEEYKAGIRTILGRIKDILNHKADGSLTWHRIIMTAATIMIDVVALFDIIWTHDPETKKKLEKHCIDTTTNIIKECRELKLEGPAQDALADLEKKLEELKNSPRPKAPEQSQTVVVLQQGPVSGHVINQYVMPGHTHVDSEGNRRVVEQVVTEVEKETHTEPDASAPKLKFTSDQMARYNALNDEQKRRIIGAKIKSSEDFERLYTEVTK